MLSTVLYMLFIAYIARAMLHPAINRRFHNRGPITHRDSPEPPGSEAMPPPTPFVPKPRDVYHVRILLRSLNLPAEIVLQILDYAQYYSVLRSHRNENISYAANSQNDSVISGLYLTSPPIPKPDPALDEDYKVTFVRFNIVSADQGWGGENGCRGTYRGSWTWFDATILRPTRDDPVLEPLETMFSRQPAPPFRRPEDATDLLREMGWGFVRGRKGNIEWKVQHNVTATKPFKHHEVEWWEDDEEVDANEHNEENGMGHGDGFVALLRPGDVVALWARARFPGWMNNVKEARIELAIKI